MRSHRQVWLVFSLLAVCIGYFSAIPQKGFVIPHFVNSGHAFVFGLGAFLLMQLFARPEAYYQVFLCALVSFLLGALVELVQPFFGRQRSLTDLFYDFLGSASAALWYISRAEFLVKRRRHYLRVLATLLILSSLAYPGYRLYIQHKVNEQAPVLLDFNAFWSSKVIWANNKSNLARVEAPSGWRNETHVGRINFPKGARYPGLSFAYIYPDWSQYDFLKFELYSNELEALSLTVRVHDTSHNNKYSDRFNHRIVIRPGLNKYSIPLSKIKSSPRGRNMDMQKIEGLAIFMVKPQVTSYVYLDNLRLSQ